MTPSVQCKEAGIKSLAELAKISGVSVQTLINWHKDKPALFETVVAGAVVIKAANTGYAPTSVHNLKDTPE